MLKGVLRSVSEPVRDLSLHCMAATAEGRPFAFAWTMRRADVTSFIVRGAGSINALRGRMAIAHHVLAHDGVATIDELSIMPNAYPGGMSECQPTDRLSTAKELNWRR